MIFREEDHSNKIKYPDLNKPTKGQELLDKLSPITSRHTIGKSIDIKDGVEIIDVKAISKD